MRVRPCLLPIVLLASLPLLVQAAGAVPPEVAAYVLALADCRKASAPVSLEPLFEAAGRAGRALTMAPAAGQEAPIESLSEAEFQALERQLEGMVVNREEILVAAPDPNFFFALAKDRGRAADVRFFEAYRQTQPDGVWAAYLEPVTDYSACTRYGALTLVTLYGEWERYQKDFPQSYVEPARRFRNEIAGALAQPGCACGSVDTIARELRAFLRAYPNAAIAPAVRARLASIEAGTSTERPSCRPG